MFSMREGRNIMAELTNIWKEFAGFKMHVMEHASLKRKGRRCRDLPSPVSSGLRPCKGTPSMCTPSFGFQAPAPRPTASWATPTAGPGPAASPKHRLPESHRRQLLTWPPRLQKAVELFQTCNYGPHVICLCIEI